MSTSYEVHKIYKFGTMEFRQDDNDTIYTLADVDSSSVRMTPEEVAALRDILNDDFADLTTG